MTADLDSIGSAVVTVQRSFAVVVDCVVKFVVLVGMEFAVFAAVFVVVVVVVVVVVSDVVEFVAGLDVVRFVGAEKECPCPQAVSVYRRDSEDKKCKTK